MRHSARALQSLFHSCLLDCLFAPFPSEEERWFITKGEKAIKNKMVDKAYNSGRIPPELCVEHGRECVDARTFCKEGDRKIVQRHGDCH